MTGVLIKKRNLDTNMHTGRISCEDEGGDCSDVSKNQGILKTVSKSPEARGDAWNYMTVHFCCFSHVVCGILCHSSHSILI